jgi:6-phosphogluconolactonase
VTSEMHILSDGRAVYRDVANEFTRVALGAVQSKGQFTVVLSGGSTPRTLFSLLATDPVLRRRIPWEKCCFFGGDERHVGPEHSASNFRMVRETLLSKIPVQPLGVFRIRGELADPLKAARDYEQALRGFFHLENGELPRSDLLLLGLGPDGHTASLFPESEALCEYRQLVAANWVHKLSSYRITMTIPVLNNSAQVVFLVCGEDKAQVLKAVLEGASQPEQLPAQFISPHNGKLSWYVDRAAAQLLSSNKLQEMSPQ